MEPAIHPAAVASDGSPKLVPFHRVVPYAIAACLMAIGISQALQIVDLKKKLATTNADAARLRRTVDLMGLRVAMLEAKDPSYASSKIMVAWDPYQHQGSHGLDKLPPPAGHDYQLWVLDPEAQAPDQRRALYRLPFRSRSSRSARTIPALPFPWSRPAAAPNRPARFFLLSHRGHNTVIS